MDSEPFDPFKLAAEFVRELREEAAKEDKLTRQAKRDYSLEMGLWDDDFPANEEGF